MACDAAPAQPVRTARDLSRRSNPGGITMRKLMTIAITAAAIMPTAAAAHDFEATFDSQAQCEVAWVQSNKIDRDFLRQVNPQQFQTKGDVMAYLTKYVRCAYDPIDDVWYFEDNRPGQ
jgi:hypothetical protein